MNENVMPWEQFAAQNAPLTNHPQVQELQRILLESGRDTSALDTVLNQVRDMESFIRQTEASIIDMKAQLETMREIQNHPVKTALQNTVRALETQVVVLCEQLNELRQSIAHGCRDALDAVRDKGLSVLDNLASFFRINPALEAMQRGIQSMMSGCENSIERIVAFDKELQRANTHLDNAGRALVGRQIRETEPQAGGATAVLSAPYRVCLLALAKTQIAVNGMLGGLQRMAEMAQEGRVDNHRSVPLMERLQAAKERALESMTNRVQPERSRSVNHALE